MKPKHDILRMTAPALKRYHAERMKARQRMGYGPMARNGRKPHKTVELMGLEWFAHDLLPFSRVSAPTLRYRLFELNWDVLDALTLPPLKGYYSATRRAQQEAA